MECPSQARCDDLSARGATMEKSPLMARQSVVRVPKTAELVAARVRRQIVRGELKEGDPLPSEAELMADFGISRPTLREAFRILEAESLISVTRGSRGGARVHAPDIRVAARYAGLLLQHAGTTLEDVQGARLVIEPPVARMLAEKCSAKGIKALRDHIVQERNAADDVVAFAELSTQFHELLVELSGNHTLALVVAMLHDIIETHAESSLSRRTDQSSIERALRSQEKLVDLIAASNPDGAEEHWRKHIRMASRRMLDVVGSKTIVDLFD
ncbi:MAG: hypothetical protein CBC48_07345 [bacterium TMED88]|nr:MAG: hypothetical protein CBC48_07345 [bacterium TMED88]